MSSQTNKTNLIQTYTTNIQAIQEITIKGETDFCIGDGEYESEKGSSELNKRNVCSLTPNMLPDSDILSDEKARSCLGFSKLN